ncbi:MAG: hypothetical protein WC775_04955 [Patescibacteria group bacterium]|jgi:hypothetical protein
MIARFHRVLKSVVSYLELLDPAKEGSAYLKRELARRGQTNTMSIGLRGKMLFLK